MTGPGPCDRQASPTRARDPKPKTGPGCRLRRSHAGARGPDRADPGGWGAVGVVWLRRGVREHCGNRLETKSPYIIKVLPSRVGGMSTAPDPCRRPPGTMPSP